MSEQDGERPDMRESSASLPPLLLKSTAAPLSGNGSQFALNQQSSTGGDNNAMNNVAPTTSSLGSGLILGSGPAPQSTTFGSGPGFGATSGTPSVSLLGSQTATNEQNAFRLGGHSGRFVTRGTSGGGLGQPVQAGGTLGGGLGQPAQAGSTLGGGLGQPAQAGGTLGGGLGQPAQAGGTLGVGFRQFNLTGNIDPSAQPTGSGGLFGQAAPAGGGGLFGQAAPAGGGGLIGQTAPAGGGGLFGQAVPAGGGGLFGQAVPAGGGGLFGQAAPAGGGGLFGQTTQPAHGRRLLEQTSEGRIIGPYVDSYEEERLSWQTVQSNKEGGHFGQTAPTGGTGLFLQQPTAQGGLGFGQQEAGEPRTIFYLVCGGEFVPEREKQCREQMSLIYNIIVEKGMASERNVLFVHGRGNKLNNIVKSFKATGQTFKLYGPPDFYWHINVPVQCPLPGPQDNAVVIFIGQGRYSENMGMGSGVNPPNQDTAIQPWWFGDLLFINDCSNPTVYRTTLEDLRAKNTLFISLANYSGESFQRAFDVNRTDMNKKLYVVCLSETFHPSKDHCLARAFAEFLDSDEWKSKSIEDLVDIIKDQYSNHPSVIETTAEVIKYTEEQYDEEVKRTGTWATGNFRDLLLKPIPSYDWEMFRKVEELKQSVEEANAGEFSSHMKEKLDDFIESMERLRVEAIKYNLHLPKPFEVIGDEDICSMTWEDFLMV